MAVSTQCQDEKVAKTNNLADDTIENRNKPLDQHAGHLALWHERQGHDPSNKNKKSEILGNCVEI